MPEHRRPARSRRQATADAPDPSRARRWRSARAAACTCAWRVCSSSSSSRSACSCPSWTRPAKRAMRKNAATPSSLSTTPVTEWCSACVAATAQATSAPTTRAVPPRLGRRSPAALTAMNTPTKPRPSGCSQTSTAELAISSANNGTKIGTWTAAGARRLAMAPATAAANPTSASRTPRCSPLIPGRGWVPAPAVSTSTSTSTASGRNRRSVACWRALARSSEAKVGVSALIDNRVGSQDGAVITSGTEVVRRPPPPLGGDHSNQQSRPTTARSSTPAPMAAAPASHRLLPRPTCNPPATKGAT